MAAIAVTLVMAAASAVVGQAAIRGANAAMDIIGDAKDWDYARETFTQQTVLTMFENMPPGYVSAVCYNMGYEVSNTSLISDITSFELRTGKLHTDYDCMFLAPGVDFFTLGDGGYINYAVYGSCEFDHDSGDVWC